MTRTQLPAWSPLSGAILARGLWQAAQPNSGMRLAERIRGEYGADRVLLTDSGTGALTLALRALGPAPRVALPAYGCFDLATAAIGAGARVRLYDLDPATLGPREESIAEVLEAGVDGLVVAHLFGVPAVSARWYQAIRDRGIVVIDDAAQGVGASLDGRPVGSLGDFGVLSFGRGKGRTGGSGGALLAVSPEGSRRFDAVLRAPLAASSLGSQAASVAKLTAQWLLGRPSLYGIPASFPWLGLGQTHYRPPEPVGELSSLAVGVLLSGWDAAGVEAGLRRLQAERWADALQTTGIKPMVIPAGADPGWLRFPIVLPEGARLALSSAAAVGLGVARGYPVALAQLPALAGALVVPDVGPGAARLATSLVTLPTHSLVSEADRRAVLRLLQS